MRFGGKGRLTDKVIDALQVFYGGAFGSIKMTFREWSGQFGQSTTIWFQLTCSRNTITVQLGINPGVNSSEPLHCWPHHTPKIPLDLAEYVKPVFTRLSDHALLEKCLLGATQNQNESFNNLVCPKTEFCSVQIAVNFAIFTLTMV